MWTPPASSAGCTLAISTECEAGARCGDRKSTRLNSSHLGNSYAVFGLKKKNGWKQPQRAVGLLVSMAPAKADDADAAEHERDRRGLQKDATDEVVARPAMLGLPHPQYD